MVTDTIADVLTRLRNAQRAGHKSVKINSSKASRSVLEVLKREGFIQNFGEKTDAEGKFKIIDVQLKYYSTGQPLIGLAQRVSRPGRRVYVGAGDLGKVYSGLGISIVSTSQGVVSDREARKLGVGGELIANIG